MAPKPHKAATQTANLIDPRTRGTNYGSGNDASKSASNLNELQSTMTPLLQVADPSLSNTAWYADTGLITGNPSIRASVQPVAFTVFFDRNDSTQVFRNPADNKPIEVRLNTSMSSFEITSKHVYNRTPSRTGMHITLWGMEPDLISGQGSTGVFMNQFGLTDFMSTAGVNDDIIKLLTSGFSADLGPIFNTTTTSVAVPAATVIGSNANVEVVTDAQTATSQVTIDRSGTLDPASQIIADQDITEPQKAFRVAAQDAFIEFLKLFQMNGNVWYHSKEYASGGKDGTNLGLIGQTQQESPTAWSSKTGTTSFQQHSRNNDVMTRGYVAMRYRNNVYLGYFKSLSWTQDAESPFQWKFNFTFQVEKTYTALYFAQPAVQQQQSTRNFGPNGARSLSQGPQEG